MSPKHPVFPKRAKHLAKKGVSLATRLARRVKRELTLFGVAQRAVDVVEETIHDVFAQEAASASRPTKPKRSMPVTALDTNTVIRYFGLGPSEQIPGVNKIWELPEQYFLELPAHLVATMTEFESHTRFHDYSLPLPAEAVGRSIIDRILGAAMREVRKELETFKSNNKDHLYLTMETRLEVTLSREEEDLTITGDADYSFWYGDPTDMSTNLVVCEAKRRGQLGSGQDQLLGYMGIVHTMRRRLNKQNCVVYGILTDVHTWWFYRIDNDSQITEWLATWSSRPSQIFSYICFILRAAYELTPTTSRIVPSDRFSVESSYFNFDIFFTKLVKAESLASNSIELD